MIFSRVFRERPAQQGQKPLLEFIRRLSALLLFGLVNINFCALCDAQATPSPTAIPLEPYLRAQAIVHATVNGKSGTFLFDTGEGVTSVSPSFAKQINCRPWSRITGFRMSGERLDNTHCDNVTFTLSNQPFGAPVVSTVDIMKFPGTGRPEHRWCHRPGPLRGTCDHHYSAASDHPRDPCQFCIAHCRRTRTPHSHRERCGRYSFMRRCGRKNARWLGLDGAG